MPEPTPDPPSKPGKRRQSTQERRALLIETAVACFVENGIAGTGIRDIARRAGVSLGNLYNHFSGKDELIGEIARLESRGLARIVAGTAREKACFKALGVFTDAYLDYSAGHVQGVLTIEITAMALRNPGIAALFAGNRALLIACLRDIIERGIAEGQVDPALDVDTTAALILDLIGATGLRIALSGRAPEPRERAALQRMLRRALQSDPNACPT